MDLATFSVDPETRVVEVNGEAVPGVVALRIEVGVGVPVPRLTLQQHAYVEPLAGSGVVHVEVPTDSGTDAKAEVLAWLAALDPDTIERQALDRQGWGSGSLAREILDTLRELAEGAL